MGHNECSPAEWTPFSLLPTSKQLTFNSLLQGKASLHLHYYHTITIYTTPYTPFTATRGTFKHVPLYTYSTGKPSITCTQHQAMSKQEGYKYS